MTKPDPTRFLTARLREYAAAKAEQIRAALEAADAAQVPLADDPTEEEYRRETLGLVTCDGWCVTAAEVGVIADGMYAVDPKCTLHGEEGQ